jgi:aryl-phospho-beta-D-glucosidase BglC (GH1 family)
MRVFNLRLIVGVSVMLVAVWCGLAVAQTAPSTQSAGEVWNVGPRRISPTTNPDAKKLSLIRVRGNKFVDSRGQVVLFRGVSIADPDNLEHEGHWNKEHFVHIKELGATIVRIPVHPAAWRKRTPVKYLELLDQAVQWCTDLNTHVIIDWHSIGNLKMELFEKPIYDTTQRETYEFWRTIASHFSGNNTVAFYELFNEPTTAGGQLGPVSWSEWKKDERGHDQPDPRLRQRKDSAGGGF